MAQFTELFGINMTTVLEKISKIDFESSSG